MGSGTKAVVIGGGLIGLLDLYHLAKFGWDGFVLMERQRTGLRLHCIAAAKRFTPAMDFHQTSGASALHHGALQELEAETGQGCGHLSKPGLAHLAQTEAREHQLRLQGKTKAPRYKDEFLRSLA